MRVKSHCWSIALMFVFTGAVGSAPAQTTAPVAGAPERVVERAAFSRTAEQEILFAEAQLRYNRGELQAAERSFAQLTEENPADVQAWYFLGLSRLDQGRPQAAVEAFDEALRLDSSLTEVYSARAKAHIQLRHFDQARADLAVFERDPAWEAQAAYLQGQLHFAEGDLEAAAEAFRRARAAGGVEQMSAEFYEGLTYLRMRELVRARTVFRESGSGADRDPTVAAASRQLDAVLAAQQRAARPWEFQISAGVEWDSNTILLGSNVGLPQDISGVEDWRFVVQPRGSYSLYRNQKVDFGIEGNGYFTFQDDLPDFNIASYQGGPYLNYRVNDRLFASARYGYNYIEFGHEKYMTRHVVTPQVTLVHPNRGYTSMFYQLQAKKFYQEVSDPFDRDGENHVFGIVQGITLPAWLGKEGQTSNLELSYRYDMQRTDGANYEGDFHILGVTYYTPLPILDLRADVGVTMAFENYDHPNTLDSRQRRREDTEIRLTAGLTRELFKNATLRVDYTYADRDSNIRTAANEHPFDYDRHQVGVRFIYTY